MIEDDVSAAVAACRDLSSLVIVAADDLRESHGLPPVRLFSVRNEMISKATPERPRILSKTNHVICGQAGFRSPNS
jgi:hypothetical protein